MDTNLQINGSIEMTLRDALMIYRIDNGHAAYVTHHNVANGQLGPATPLTGKFLDELAEQLRKRVKIEILPPYVLARTHDTIVWWTPATARRMYFTNIEDEKVEGLSGHVYPQPALVWMVRRRDLLVRAMASSARPHESTPLSIAPYWNVSDSGIVCLGSAKTPDTATAKNLDAWVDGFFKSKFSHPNATKIVRGVGLYHEFLKSLQGASIYFPIQCLIDAKQTLQQFIGGE